MGRESERKRERESTENRSRQCFIHAAMLLISLPSQKPDWKTSRFCRTVHVLKQRFAMANTKRVSKVIMMLMMGVSRHYHHQSHLRWGWCAELYMHAATQPELADERKSISVVIVQPLAKMDSLGSKVVLRCNQHKKLHLCTARWLRLSANWWAIVELAMSFTTMWYIAREVLTQGTRKWSDKEALPHPYLALQQDSSSWTLPSRMSLCSAAIQSRNVRDSAKHLKHYLYIWNKGAASSMQSIGWNWHASKQIIIKLSLIPFMEARPSNLSTLRIATATR